MRAYRHSVKTYSNNLYLKTRIQPSMFYKLDLDIVRNGTNAIYVRLSSTQILAC